ncbi:MAG: cytochrome c-type biogenesis protein CcmH, partial [Chloroflexota bacterium]
QGKTGPEITALMVARYGEQVLSAPPKRGFNLTAWILPFVAILLGGVVVYSALVAWVRRGQRQRASELVVAETTDEKYQHRLEDELSHFTEMGFR